mmetsp:Transcript_27652/g.51344  ORF Transcript_27652/g.51344 Transcript_27652/m.51344 type:complete len:228 (+) Transcript_27652:506-1189(+)
MPDLGQFFEHHEQGGQAHPGQVHHPADKAKRHKAPTAHHAKRTKAQPHAQPPGKTGAPVAQEISHRTVTHAVANLLGAGELERPHRQQQQARKNVGLGNAQHVDDPAKQQGKLHPGDQRGKGDPNDQVTRHHAKPACPRAIGTDHQVLIAAQGWHQRRQHHCRHHNGPHPKERPEIRHRHIHRHARVHGGHACAHLARAAQQVHIHVDAHGIHHPPRHQDQAEKAQP